MRVNTKFLPEGVELPYIIEVDNPKGNIGIFGDSFAQLAEFFSHPHTENWNHETSWIYFLANILNMNCETYGVSQCSMGDIFHTLLNSKNYDYYIIFCTLPHRKNIFSKILYNIKSCRKIKEFVKNKKVLFVYWDEQHRLFNFEKPYMITTFHKTNANSYEIEAMNLENAKHNTLDQLAGPHHMSARGNLLFALKLSKLFIANYLKN